MNANWAPGPGLDGNNSQQSWPRRAFPRIAAAIVALAFGGVIRAEAPKDIRPPASSASPAPTYADLADLADSAPLVLHMQVRSQTSLDTAPVRGITAGFARVYLVAQPKEALAGSLATTASVEGGPSTSKARALALHYLAEVPRDARGKPVSLRKRDVLAFARPVPGHPDQIQLVAPDAQMDWTPQLDRRVRAVLAELRAPDAPGRLKAVRDAMYVPGTLAGAGETQITLATTAGPTVSLSITHQPGQQAAWAVAFGEVFDLSGRPPAHDTLAWYRLACFLPHTLPAESNLSSGPADRAQAAADYRLVIDGLGPCPRTLR